MEENFLKKEPYDRIKTDSGIFEFIQSGSLDGIWYWDLENPEQEWMSSKFWETLGYNPDERKHLSSEWQDIIFQDDLKLALENFNRHCSDPNHPFDQIVRYRHSSGSTVWIRCRGLAIRDEHGKPLRMLGAHTDISDLKEAERTISRLTEEYEKVFNGTQDSMFLVRVLADGTFRYIRTNRSHQLRTGIPLEQITGKTPQDLLGQAMGDGIAAHYRKCVDTRSIVSYEEALSLPGGDRVWSTTLTPILEGVAVSYIVGSAEDITERKALELELERSANHDQLTGLPNRRLFFERLERIVLENERDRQQFALLFVDLDGFKDINDLYGHEAGDEVLITVGNRLLQCIRKSDSAARMGGDEFTVIIRNVTNRKSVDAVVRKVHSHLNKVIRIGTIECRVNASIGIALYPVHGQDSKTLLRNADISMYEAKRNGKGGAALTESMAVAL